MGFRPRAVPSAITLAALAVLIGLGVWQLERRSWKADLIVELETRLQAPPLSVADLAAGTAEELRYRRVEVTGRPAGGPFLWRGRTRDGEVGAHVLDLYEAGDAPALIVDRGWVPYGPGGQPEAFRPAPPGPLIGLVREAGWHGFGFLRPAQQPETNTWLFVDPAAMARAAGYTGPVNETVYVAAAPSGAGEPPLAMEPRISLPDNHMQYAITWFAVAVGVLVIYVLWHLRQSPTPET